MFDGNTIGIIIATFTGPIAAVIVTRWVDKLRDTEKRRLEIFRTLMRTRKVPLSPDHVGALNVIELEFHNCNKVMVAWKELLTHFETAYGENRTLDELNSANVKSDTLRTSLLSAIANELGYKLDQMEIHRGGYAPRGWGVEMDEQTTVRRGLADILGGRRSLPIAVFSATGNPLDSATGQQQLSPFPPKPEK